MNAGTISYPVRSLRFAELDAGTLEAWRSLEGRALEANAYLSPHHVVPAVRHLARPGEVENVRFLFVERETAGDRGLVGACVLAHANPRRAFPLPHLRAYRSPHSYLSGFLIDREEAEPAIRALLSFLCRQRWVAHGVDLEDYPAEGRQAALVAKIAAQLGLTWSERKSTLRASFVPAEGGDDYLAARLSPRRAKNLRRSRRLLESQGRVKWRLLMAHEVDDACIDRFIRLEHEGWKAEQGSSLLSHEAHETFFRATMRSFGGDGRLFFTELLVDDDVIASTSNFLSGGIGFAFKVGWSPRYAKIGPGFFNEVEFVRHAPALCAGIPFIDSGAEPDSFIEELWPGRRRLVSGVLATTAIGSAVARGVHKLREARAWWGVRARPGAQPRAAEDSEA